ncbi:uncharacterized protein MONBRDRAFT_9972 [Monosiga brevicollis MX1]|uniref:Uncharacterized protein n=1 Tax=Monosiga brevicollis TaxID=81824 RepID=A9V4T1_MONBE|nr:uncharacterized protein MONBRDRAFT_9972 [Monosiga brevicollis MX1]EDQ87509.1 predicted protein [Monosiga brevicollis MX1]|eukprot:XP_001747769.1 hypothetical protein [Monosiga brevicollis MX1]
MTDAGHPHHLHYPPPHHHQLQQHLHFAGCVRCGDSQHLYAECPNRHAPNWVWTAIARLIYSRKPFDTYYLVASLTGQDPSLQPMIECVWDAGVLLMERALIWPPSKAPFDGNDDLQAHDLNMLVQQIEAFLLAQNPALASYISYITTFGQPQPYDHDLLLPAPAPAPTTRRRSRAELTEEQREAVRVRESDRRRQRRSDMSGLDLERLRHREADQQRIRRATMPETRRNQLRRSNAERQRVRRARMTSHEIIDHRKRNAEHTRRRRAQLDEAQLEAMRRRDAERQRRRRANMRQNADSTRSLDQPPPSESVSSTALPIDGPSVLPPAPDVQHLTPTAVPPAAPGH